MESPRTWSPPGDDDELVPSEAIRTHPPGSSDSGPPIGKPIGSLHRIPGSPSGHPSATAKPPAGTSKRWRRGLLGLGRRVSVVSSLSEVHRQPIPTGPGPKEPARPRTRYAEIQTPVAIGGSSPDTPGNADRKKPMPWTVARTKCCFRSWQKWFLGGNSDYSEVNPSSLRALSPMPKKRFRTEVGHPRKVAYQPAVVARKLCISRRRSSL